MLTREHQVEPLHPRAPCLWYFRYLDLARGIASAWDPRLDPEWPLGERDALGPGRVQIRLATRRDMEGEDVRAGILRGSQPPPRPAWVDAGGAGRATG